MNIRKDLQAVVDDWDDHIWLLNHKTAFDETVLNKFIDDHEDILVSFGLFLEGLRVKSNLYVRETHENFDAVLGIVYMSIKVIRNKANGVL
jgi:hypothetical protein